MAAKRRKNLRDKGVFAAFGARGNLLTATVRTTKKDVETILHKFNPPVVGFSYFYKILPITLNADQILQYKLIFDEED